MLIHGKKYSYLWWSPRAKTDASFDQTKFFMPVHGEYHAERAWNLAVIVVFQDNIFIMERKW